MLKDYAFQYEEETVYVKNYTLIIESLPESFKIYKNQTNIMHALWSQIHQKIEHCKQSGIIRKDLDPIIVDINFALTDFKVFNKFK